MVRKEVDIQIYNEAKAFLLVETPKEVTESILISYLTLPPASPKTVSLNDLFGRLLESAQNSNMKAGVIGGSIGGVDKLKKVLFDFNVSKVVQVYGGDTDKLLRDIVEILRPRGKVRRTPKSIWPKYCRTVVSIAEFLSQFKGSEEFFDWAGYFYNDKKSMAALPMILEAEIYGVGFPLACDFLKELGYLNYGKPDIHVIQIFKATSLVEPRASTYQVFKAIIRVSESLGTTPYDVDKLFWLIGSGYFYNNPEIGRKGRVGSLKKRFIKEVASKYRI